MVSKEPEISKEFPKEINDSCLKDEPCRKELLKKYTKSLEIQHAINLESAEIGKVAEECFKDDKCNEKAKDNYLGLLKARKTNAVLESVDKTVNIVWLFVKFGLLAALLIFLIIFVRWLITGIPIAFDELTQALKDAVENIGP